MIEYIHVMPLILYAAGVVNFMLLKTADEISSSVKNGDWYYFQHPFLQAIFIFLGETLCVVVFSIASWAFRNRRDGSEDRHYLTKGERGVLPKQFIIPGILDSIGTVLMLCALFHTYPSIFIAGRALSMVFVTLLSRHYLNTDVKIHHKIGLVTVILGMIILTLFHGLISENYDRNAVVTGIFLVYLSTIFHSIQMTYEEKQVKSLDIPPLQAVGWKGLFALIFTIIVMIPMNYIKIFPPLDQSTHHVVDDFLDALYEFYSHPTLVILHLILLVSAGFYAASALFIAKETKTSNRLIIDSLRIFLIMPMSLYLGWEPFYYGSMFSVAVILCGIFLYFDNYIVRAYRWLIMRVGRRRYNDLIDEPTNAPVDPNSGISSTPADAII